MRDIAKITFLVFLVEGIIHYNLGAKSENKCHEWSLPPKDNLIELAMIVFVFSIINAVLLKE